MKELRIGEQVVQLDDADFDAVSGWRWRIYRGVVDRRTTLDAKEFRVPLTHQILKLPISRRVIHLDGNNLNCQRDNLKIDNAASNLPANSVSGFHGVRWHAASNKWEVRINIAGTRIHVGLFPTRLQAAVARDEAWNEKGLRLRKPNFFPGDFEFLEAAGIYNARIAYV